MKKTALMILGIVVLNVASGQLMNEIVVNPNGSDSNCEYVELIGPANSSLMEHYFVAIEGDGTSAIRGIADVVFDLNASNFGSNGLLVITAMDLTGPCGTRDYGAPATTVIRAAVLDGGRFENGTTSFLLINSPVPIVEFNDYDQDDDGVLELPVNAVIVDGVAWTDGGASDIMYGTVNLPSTAGGTNDMATRFPTNQTVNDDTAWYHGDMDGNADSVSYDLTQVSDNFPEGGMLTPGSVNVPDPDIIFKDDFE